MTIDEQVQLFIKAHIAYLNATSDIGFEYNEKTKTVIIDLFKGYPSFETGKLNNSIKSVKNDLKSLSLKVQEIELKYRYDFNDIMADFQKSIHIHARSMINEMHEEKRKIIEEIKSANESRNS